MKLDDEEHDKMNAMVGLYSSEEASGECSDYDRDSPLSEEIGNNPDKITSVGIRRRKTASTKGADPKTSKEAEDLR